MTNTARGGGGEKKRVLHVGSYEVGRTLGNGSFGKVKLGTNVFTKEKVPALHYLAPLTVMPHFRLLLNSLSTENLQLLNK